MLRNPCPRRGLSLVEVLIAMFIMAIGMIAIFTLFPLGAIKIGQALKDDRCSQTATQADAYMRAYWRSEVTAKINTPTGVTEPFFGAMETNTASPPPATGYTDLVTPSFPVLIDPAGVKSRRGRSDEQTVAITAAPSSVLARRVLSLVADSAAFRVVSMSDDLTFEPNGTAATPLIRQGRYSWAALVQRTNASQRGSAELTILVFDGRARLPAITPPITTGVQQVARPYNDELMLTETNAGVVTPGSRQLEVRLPKRDADDPVLAREGGWVMVYDHLGATKRVSFHRVTALTELEASSGQPAGLVRAALDLETPIPGTIPALPALPVALVNPQLYFFAGLSEVFERVPLGPDNNN